MIVHIGNSAVEISEYIDTELFASVVSRIFDISARITDKTAE